MEYKLLEKNDLEFMEEVLIDDNMVFDIDNLKGFLNDTSSFGFIAKDSCQIRFFRVYPDPTGLASLHGIQEHYQIPFLPCSFHAGKAFSGIKALPLVFQDVSVPARAWFWGFPAIFQVDVDRFHAPSRKMLCKNLSCSSAARFRRMLSSGIWMIMLLFMIRSFVRSSTLRELVARFEV